MSLSHELSYETLTFLRLAGMRMRAIWLSRSSVAEDNPGDVALWKAYWAIEDLLREMDK